MTSIKFFQLNMHNAAQANTELLNQISAANSPYIALLQEPHLKNGKIQYPPGCTQLEQQKQPRAAIYVSKSLNFSLLPSLCTQFCTTIAGNLNGQKTVVSSIYLHGKQPITPPWLLQIIQYCKQNKYALIIGTDANAHSNMWGPTPAHNDPRGEKLEEFILRHALNIENIGIQPTFRNSRNHTSNIDLTLTYNLKSKLTNWTVHDNVNNYSDHNTITFSLNTHKLKPTMVRPWEKCDWESFTTKLSNSTIKFPPIITQKILDTKTKELQDLLTSTLDLYCKKRPLKTTHELNSWYTNKLKKERHAVSKAYGKWKSDFLNKHLETQYKTLNKAYKTNCKQARMKLNPYFFHTFQSTQLKQLNTFIKPRLRSHMYQKYGRTPKSFSSQSSANLQ